MACDFMKNIGKIALDRMNILKQKLNEINQEQTRIRSWKNKIDMKYLNSGQTRSKLLDKLILGSTKHSKT